MKLKKFNAVDVHGYLNYDIDFDERITFLIGINGTGKTSVLKLILGLISPSFEYLNSIEFDSAELICYDLNRDIKISATKVNELELALQLNIAVADENGNKSTRDVSGKLVRNLQSEGSSYDGDEMAEKQRLIIAQFETQDFVKEVQNLTTPLFLGLDRRVYEGQQIDRMRSSYLYRKKYRHFLQNNPLNVSLIEIQEIIFDYVRIIASKQPRINQDFKNKILLQSFEFISSPGQYLELNDRKLKEKRTDALAAFNNLNIEGFTEHVNKFFDQMEKVLTEVKLIDKISSKKPEEKIQTYQKWFNNQPQLKRIYELIEYNNQYQNEINRLYEPLEKAKNIINEFFKESKKTFSIDPQGEISVTFKNGRPAKIFELSSGEKQIVTMLGHLIFFEDRFKAESGIFIIDEPELSLHLAWQEIFVKSIMEASPQTQFILATHSPAIIGDFPDETCQDLAKFN